MDNSFIVSRIIKSYQMWADIWIRSGWRIQEHAQTGSARLIAPDGTVRLRGNVANCRSLAGRMASPSVHRQGVVLLHGMGRTSRSFEKLAVHLRHEDFAVANVGYASLVDTADTHIRRLNSIIDAMLQDEVREISFIGHSLGGLLVRRLLAKTPQFGLGRIVMLGTPNQGSALGQRLSSIAFYRYVFGPNGQDVIAGAVRSLPVPDTEIAIIAGGNGGHGYNRFLPGDNDGIVQVEETRLDGRETFLRLPCLHTFLPTNQAAIQATSTFLKTGRIS